ncbi:MAG TPA: hypothetical protein VII01_01795 [Solirubrobacteraceae bacterium]
MPKAAAAATANPATRTFERRIQFGAGAGFTTRMPGPDGRHDDRAVALALAVTTLLSGPQGAGFAPGLAEVLLAGARRDAAKDRARLAEATLAAGHVDFHRAFGEPPPERIVPVEDVLNSAGARHEEPRWEP